MCEHQNRLSLHSHSALQRSMLRCSDEERPTFKAQPRCGLAPGTCCVRSAHDPDVVSFEWLLLIITFKGVLSVAQLSQRFEAPHRWANTHLWPSQTHLRSRNVLVTHTQQQPRSAEQWKKWKKMLSDWHCVGERTLLLHMLQNSFYAKNASLWLETWSLHNKKTPTVVTQTDSVTAFSSQHLKTDHFTCAQSCCICFSFVDIRKI